MRIGTCSWADETLVKTWYPPHVKSAEGRLQHYAEQFDTVELNSSYYALPTARDGGTGRGARRRGFIFHVKAFGMMTRHPVRPEQLPADLRAGAGGRPRAASTIPRGSFAAEVFDRFRSALEPLRGAGKLGGILMQLPPYFTLKPSASSTWSGRRSGSAATR